MSPSPPLARKWSSQRAFVLAAIGVAVGLGNIWRFPFITGENGGSAFVLVYFGFVVIIGLPLIMAELAIGRAGGASAITSMQKLVHAGGFSPFWLIIGWAAIVIPLIALTYYSVVSGWALGYIFKAASGAFSGIDVQGSTALFGALQSSFWQLALWHSLNIALIVFIIARGLHNGLELAVKIMMPLLFIALLALCAYALITGDARAAIRFLFTPDFSRLSFQGVMLALGQAFFSLAIGVGALITYGAYMGRDVHIPAAARTIVIADTGVAILAGLTIFPLVFAYGLEIGEGPGLIFISLPIAFGQMPGGAIFATAFFALLFGAAFTSSIAMLEPVVAWLEDRGHSRPKMTVLVGAAAWAVGLLMVASFNSLKDFHPLAFFKPFADFNLFRVADYLVTNIMLPFNALLIALFASWVMSKKTIAEQLGFKDPRGFSLWQFSVRYLVPLAIGFIVYTLVFGG